MREILFHVCLAAGFCALGIGIGMTVDDYDLRPRLSRAWRAVLQFAYARRQLAVAEAAADDQWADTLHDLVGVVPSSEPVPAIAVSDAPPLMALSGPPAAVYAFRPPEQAAELPVLEAESWEVQERPVALPGPVYRGQALAERYARLMASCTA